jgi:hypothetical protein
MPRIPLCGMVHIMYPVRTACGKGVENDAAVNSWSTLWGFSLVFWPCGGGMLSMWHCVGQVQSRVVVPDRGSWGLEVVVVRRIINLGTGNLEWGGNGKGLRKGRSVYK